MLDDIHKRKIYMADAIYVINVEGFIDELPGSESPLRNKLLSTKMVCLQAEMSGSIRAWGDFSITNRKYIVMSVSEKQLARIKKIVDGLEMARAWEAQKIFLK